MPHILLLKNDRKLISSAVMQLDVLSVFKLPASSASQPGQFFLQEDGSLTLKVETELPT